MAHVFNRGVDRRRILNDEKDYYRFVHNLLFLNNQSGKIRVRRKNKLKDINILLSERKPLVDILKWSLLPNHYHLLLHEKIDGGIVEFTKRIGNAYTKYFNTKQRGRSGYLFQNSAKMVPILDHSQMLYIPIYIDLNCLDVFVSNWKNKIIDSNKAIKFLSNYKWSSFKSYYGGGNFDEVVDMDLFYEMFSTTSEKYKEELKEFIKEPIGLELADLAGRPKMEKMGSKG